MKKILFTLIATGLLISGVAQIDNNAEIPSKRMTIDLQKDSLDFSLFPMITQGHIEALNPKDFKSEEKFYKTVYQNYLDEISEEYPGLVKEIKKMRRQNGRTRFVEKPEDIPGKSYTETDRLRFGKYDPTHDSVYIAKTYWNRNNELTERSEFDIQKGLYHERESHRVVYQILIKNGIVHPYPEHESTSVYMNVDGLPEFIAQFNDWFMKKVWACVETGGKSFHESGTYEQSLQKYFKPKIPYYDYPAEDWYAFIETLTVKKQLAFLRQQEENYARYGIQMAKYRKQIQRYNKQLSGPVSEIEKKETFQKALGIHAKWIELEKAQEDELWFLNYSGKKSEDYLPAMPQPFYKDEKSR